MNNSLPPPADQPQLETRASAMAGKTIGQLAAEMRLEVPENLKQKKGWQGQFIEACLGADSGNLSQPDFNHLGIELKTLPIDYQGKVLESTYVCVLNLTNTVSQQWQQSPVFKKLNHVLWVPIAKTKDQSVMEYRVATPFLWRAPESTLQLLQQDWETAMELVSLGKVDQLNARLGEILQVRPKAANSRVLTETFDEQGNRSQTLPRGFYLRSSFTQAILAQHLKLS